MKKIIKSHLYFNYKEHLINQCRLLGQVSSGRRQAGPGEEQATHHWVREPHSLYKGPQLTQYGWQYKKLRKRRRKKEKNLCFPHFLRGLAKNSQSCSLFVCHGKLGSDFVVR